MNKDIKDINMKDSGVDWIGEIPEHWEIKRIKDLFTFGNGLSIKKEHLIIDGNPCITYGDIHRSNMYNLNLKSHTVSFVSDDYLSSNKNKVYVNDFIFADTSEDMHGVGNFFYIENVNNYTSVFAGYHTVILRKKDNSRCNYIKHFLQSNLFKVQLHKKVKGVKVYSITKGILSECYVAIPPRSEQDKIANFLDDKVTKIDRIIELGTQRIKSLREYRTSLIYETVTKGLNKDAVLKDSGIDWIGEIPEHWKIKRVKDVFIKHSKSKLASRLGNKDGLYDFFVSGKKIKKIDTFNEIEEKILLPTGGNFYVHYGEKKYSYSTDVIAITCKNIITQKYVFYFFKCFETKYHELFFYGTGLKHLNVKKLFASTFSFPPIDEQQAIIESLDKKTSIIDKEIELLINQIKSFEKYKESLIYECVTGKYHISTLEV